MPSRPMSGAAAIDSMGLTEAKVTPIITGSRIPTPVKPIHCTSVASPQANRSALIRKATSSGGSFSARPMIKGTATAPAYITSTCCRPSASSRGVGSIWSTGWRSVVVVMDGPLWWGLRSRLSRYKPRASQLALEACTKSLLNGTNVALYWTITGDHSPASLPPEPGRHVPLIKNRYGKGRVRVMRIHRDGDRHEVSQLDVRAMIEGDFAR